MYRVYIIQSTKSEKHYIGSTENIDKRIAEHNKNQVKSTRHKGPYSLVYSETLATKTEARKRENQIKRYKGNSKFKDLIKSGPHRPVVRTPDFSREEILQ